MADSKVSALPAASALTGTEVLPVVQGGASKQATSQAIANLAVSAVTSVNGLNGAVTLTQDNVGDGTTYKQYSATEKTKLSGIATGATANDTDANLKDRANHTGTQIASTISDFSEAVDDRVAALLTAGTNVTLTYNDAANTLTIDATASGGSGLTQPQVLARQSLGY